MTATVATNQTNIQALTDPIEILTQLISILNDKEKAVIKRRYGLENQPIETLAAIGEDFKVTRERVRQIQAYSLKKLQRNARQSNLTAIHQWAQTLLKEHGDIVTETKFESQLCIKFPEYKEAIQELKLATILFDDICHETNKIHFRPHFRKCDVSIGTIKLICKTARKLLGDRNDIMSQNQLLSQIQENLRNGDVNYRKKLILAALKLDRRITVKSDSISLTSWRHVNPKTLYDKILFTLRKGKKPLHFTDITNQIVDANFDRKSVSQQAVHNELINKDEFVLVGRGVYALKEWGYKRGTVTDVIIDILKNEGAQQYHQLIENVLKRREVKPITVQININNKDLFHRDRNNMVTLVAR